MKTARNALIKVASAMAFAAMAATNCSADLLCYEGFSPAGTNLDLASTATGTGFAGGWTNVTGAGGITRLGQVTGIPGYPANDYYAAPTGGCAQGNTSWNWACYVRPMSTPVDMTSGNTYYVSWLFNDESASMNCDLRLMLGDENARFFFGIGYGGGRVAKTDISGTQQPWTKNINYNPPAYPSLQGNSLFLIVAQISPSSISLRYYHYDPIAGTGDLVDADPSTVTWDVTATTDLSQEVFDYFGIGSAGEDGQTVDQIRIGTTWGDVVNLTAPTTITFLTQPQPQTVAPTGAFALTATATGGTGNYTYSWQKNVGAGFVNISNGGNVSGAKTSTLTVSNAQPGDAGVYQEVVSDGASTATSSAATITVVPQPVATIATYAGITLTNGFPGFHYQVDYSTNLGTTWLLLQDISSLTQNPYTVIDYTPMGGQVQRYYRTVLVP